MIYFTIPSSSGLVPVDTNVFIDRDPSANSSLNLHAYSSGTYGTAQYAPNGVNIRDEQLSISIKNLPAATALIINNYFKLLKTSNLTLTFPEGNKNYYIEGWNITIKNLLYADVSAELELMYL